MSNPMPLVALRDDLREAVRRIRRTPRTTLLAIGTLALGIGAATAVFTMAYTVLLASPPYREPGRIVSLSGILKGRAQGVSGADFLDYRKESGLFEAAALAAGRLVRSLLYGMSERDVPVYLSVIAVVSVATLAACRVPAERAARADPAAALREQG